jgi:hypothetical protein
MAYNSATESFEARSDSNQNFATVLSGEALCTQGSNDLFKKATSNNLNFAVDELPSTDDLMKQLYEAKGQPLYDKADKAPAPHDEDKPQLKGWDDVIKAANEAQHKIAENAKKDPDVKKVTETYKPGEKIETVIVERKDGSVTTYKPDGTVERKPAHGEQLKHEEAHQKSHPPEHKAPDQKAPQHKEQDHKAPDKKAPEHKTPERKPAAKLPYALPGNARLEDWLE